MGGKVEELRKGTAEKMTKCGASADRSGFRDFACEGFRNKIRNK
jgi:hypothetical protein